MKNKTLDKFIKENTSIPCSYIKHMEETEKNGTMETIDINIDDDVMAMVSQISNDNKTSVNIVLNYILYRAVFDKEKEIWLNNGEFDNVLSVFDFDDIDEDSFEKLVENNQRVLIINEKLEKSGVLISADLYKELKNI